MSDASADEVVNAAPYVPGPPTVLRQLQPIEPIPDGESFVDGGDNACAPVGEDGHEVAGFASTMPGNDSNASLKATAASINIAAAAVESTDGAQSGGIKKLFPPKKGAANAFTSSGGLSTSPPQPPPPPPAYDLALTMPLSPRRYRQSAATKPVPSTDRADTAHVSPSQSPHYTPWASSSPGARTKTTTATSPLRKGTTAPTAVGAGAAAGAAESVLLGPPPPPPYEVIFSPKASAAEHAEAPRGDSGASSVTAAGLDQVTSPVPPSVSPASSPTDPVGRNFSRVFGAAKSLDVPTTGGTTREEAGGKEKKEKQEPKKKKDLSDSAVSRLRRMFERNNSDSKKRASLEARPLPRPIAAVAVSFIGKRKEVEETAAAVAPASTNAAGESVALGATAGVQVPAVGTEIVGIAPVVALEKTTGAGPAPMMQEAASSAGEESYVAEAAVSAGAQDEPSVLAQPAFLPVADTSSTPSNRKDWARTSESSLAQAASSGKASGEPVISSPANAVVGEEQAPREKQHMPTEEEAPTPAEKAETTKVAVKEASTFGVSLQKLVFGSSKDAGVPKASESAAEGPASVVHHWEKGSPDAETGLPGATRGQAEDEFPLATASIAENNSDATGDEAGAVGVVTTQGITTNPPMPGASNGAFLVASSGMDQAPVATVDDVLEEEMPSVVPDRVSMAEPGSEDGRAVTGPWCAMPVAVQDGALEVSQDAALPASVDVAVADIVDDDVDGATTEHEKTEDRKANTAGPVVPTARTVPDAVPDAMEAVTDQLALIGAPVSGGGVDDSTSPLSAGFTAAGNDVSVALDAVQTEVETVTSEAENTEPDQPGSVGESLVEGEDAGVPVAAADGQFGTGEAMSVTTESASLEVEQMVELVSDDADPAVVDMASPAVDDTAGSAEGTEGVEPVATQLSSLIVDGLPEVEAAALSVEGTPADTSTNEVTDYLPIEQFGGGAAAGNEVVECALETEPEQPVPEIETLMDGVVVLAAAVERKDDEGGEELNVANAAPLSRVEKLRQMFDQNVSRANEKPVDDGVAGVAQDTEAVETEEREVVEDKAVVAGEDIPVATMPFSPPAARPGEEEQPGALERGEGAPDGGEEVVAVAALNAAEPWAIADKQAEIETAEMAQITTIDDISGVNASSATLDVFMVEAGWEEGTQVAVPEKAMPAAAQTGAPEVSQDLAATGLDAALPTSVDGIVVDTVDDDVDGGTSELEKTGDQETSMAGEGPAVATGTAVPAAVSDAMEAEADQLAPISAQVSYVGVEDNTLSLSEGLATAGDDVSDVQPEVEPVTPEDTSEPGRPVSGSDGLVEGDDAAVPTADTDGESGAVEAMPVTTELASVEQMPELVSDDTAPAAVDVASPAGDGTAGSAEGAEEVEPVATQLSSLIVEDSSVITAVNTATTDSSIEQSVPVTEAPVEGDVMLSATVQEKDGEEDEELNMVGAAPISRVEELRRVFDQGASRADEEEADGGVARIAHDKEAIETEQGEVVEDTSFALEHRPTAPAAGGDIPVVAMPLYPVEGLGEDEPSALKKEEDAADGGNDAGAVAVSDTAEPSAVADQLPEVQPVDHAPIVVVDRVMEVDAAYMRPDAVSMAEASSEDGVREAGPSEVRLVAVQDGAPDVSQELVATGPDGAPPTSVGVVFAGAADVAVDGEITEDEATGCKDEKMPGGGPDVIAAAAAPEPYSDVIETVADQLALNGAPMSGGGFEGSTLPLSVGCATVGDEVSATPQHVQTGVEQPVSASEDLKEAEGAVVSASATDEASGAGEAMPMSTVSVGVEVEQTAEELTGDDTAPAAVDTATPTGNEVAASSESSEGVEPVETQLSSLVVDGLPEIEAVASIVDIPSANTIAMAVDDSLIERLVESADDAVVDAAPEAERGRPVPVIEALMEGDAVSAAAVQKGHDDEDVELNVSGAAPLSQVEKLRQMFDQNASRVSDETDAEMAGVAHDEEKVETDGEELVQDIEFVAEQQPAVPAAGGGIPVVPMPLSPAKDTGEDDQPGALDGEEGAADDDDAACAGAVLNTDEPPAIADQLPEEETQDQVAIAMVEDVIEENAASVQLGAVGLTNAVSEKEARVAGSCVAVPVPVQDTTTEISQDLAATGLDAALPPSVDVAFADFVHGSADGGVSEQEKAEDKDVTMAGEGVAVAMAAAVPDAAADAVEAVTDQLAPIGAPVSLGDGEVSTLSLSEGLATVGDDVSVTLDNVQPDVETVRPEDTSEPQRPVSGSDGLLKGVDAAVPTAGTDGESGVVGAMPVTTESASLEVEQMVELVSDDTAPAEADMASSAVDGKAGSAEGTEGVEPVATQLSSLIVNGLPEVEAAALSGEGTPAGTFANEATEFSPVEQLAGNAAAGNAVVDCGLETEPEQSVPEIETSMGGDVVLGAGLERKGDEGDDELNAASAVPLSRVEEPRQMFNQNASRTDEETGEVAGVAQDKDAVQTEEVGHETAFVAEPRLNAPGAGGDNPMAPMPLFRAEEAGEDEQPSDLETEEGPPEDGGEAVACAVLDMAGPSVFADKQPEMATADEAPIAAVQDVIEEGAAPVWPEPLSATEIVSEDRVRVAESWVAMPVAVQGGTLAVSQELAVTKSGVELLPPVVFSVADTVDGAANGERTEEENQDGKAVSVAGGVPFAATVAAVPDAVFDAIEAVTDQPAPTGVPVSGGDGEYRALPLAVGSATPAHGLSSSVSVGDQTPGTEPVDTLETAAAGEQAKGDDVSVVLDDVCVKIESVVPEEEIEPEQPGLASSALVEGEDAVVPAAASDAEPGAGEAMPLSTNSSGVEVTQTVEELVGDDTVPAEVDMDPVVVDTTGSLEGARIAEPVGTMLPSPVVDEVPEIEAAASAVPDPSASSATDDSIPDTEPAQFVPMTETSVERGVVLAAAVERLEDEVDEEPDLAAPLSRVEELRQMFDQNASRADEEIVASEAIGVAQDANASQPEKEEVVHETAFAAEQLPTVRAAGGDNPMATMPISPAEGAGNQQPGSLKREKNATDGGDEAVAGAVLDAAEPSAAADQLPEMATAGQAPLTTLDDVIEMDAASATPEAVSMADVRSEDGTHVAGPWVAMPVAVQDDAAEVSLGFAATESDGALTTSVDVAVSDIADGSADGERTEYANPADKEVTMVDGVPIAATAVAVPDAVSGAVEAATDQLAPTSAPVSGGGGEDYTPSLPAGSACLVHDMSSSASMTNQPPDGEPVEAVALAVAAAVELAAGDEVSVTLDDVQAEMEPVTPEQRVSAGGPLMDEEDEVVYAAAADGESSDGEAILGSAESASVDVEQTTEEPVSGDTAPAEVDAASHAGDDTAGSSEGAEAVELAAVQLSSAVVDSLPGVEAASPIVEDPSSNPATDDSPIEQLPGNATAHESVVDAGPEIQAEQPVAQTETVLVDGDALLAAAVEKEDGDEVGEELNMVGAAPLSRVEELRHMFDQKAPRADGEDTNGDAAGVVAHDKESFQTDEAEVVEDMALATECLPTAPAAGGDIPVVATSFSPAEGPGEDGQPGALEREEGAPDGGDEAVASFKLDTAEPSVVADKLAAMEVADMAPIATVDDVLEEEMPFVAPDRVSMAEPGSEDGRAVTGPWCAMPVAVQDGALEVSQDLVATGSDAALPASVDVAVADIVDDDVDGATTEQEKTADRTASMAGERPVVPTAGTVPDAVPDAMEAVTDQLALIGAPVSNGGVDDSTSPLSAGFTAAGNDVSAALDAVQTKVETVTPEAENTEPDQPGSVGESLVEGEDAGVPVAAADGQFGTGEAMSVTTESASLEVEQMVELVRDGTAPAEVDMASSAVDGKAGSAEGGEGAEPVATQLSSLIVDGLAEVEAAALSVEGTPADTSANEATEFSPIEQFAGNASAGNEVVDCGLETEPEQRVPEIEASMDGVVVLAAAVERKDDEGGEKLDVADAAPLSRVEELRQMFGQNASRANEKPVDDGVAGVAQDTQAVETEEREVVEDKAVVAGEGIPVATMLFLPPAARPGEEEQPGALKREEGAPDGGEEVVAVAALNAAEPWAIANKQAEIETAEMGQIATIDDVSGVNASSATLDVFMVEAGSEEGTQVAVPEKAMPAAAQTGAPEVSQDIAATGLDAALPASVDGIVVDTVDDDVDGGTSELEKTEDMEASMAGEGPAVATGAAVPDAVSDAMEAVADQLAPIGAPMAVGDGEVSTLSLSEGLAMAGDDVSVTRDDVQPEVEPVTPEDTSEPERPVSGSNGLVEGDDTTVPAADTDGESSAVEAMPVTTESASVEVEQMVELVSDDTAPAEADMASSAVDGTAGSAEGIEGVEPMATQLSSLIVNGLPEVEAAALSVEGTPAGTSANEATQYSPIEQFAGNAATGYDVVDCGLETEPEQPVPEIETSMEGDVVLGAAVERKDDEGDDEPNAAGAVPLSRVEELRQMFDQNASRTGDETVEETGVAQNTDASQPGQRQFGHETAFASEQLPKAPAAGGGVLVTAMPLPPAEVAGGDEQPGGLDRQEDAIGGGEEAELTTAADQLPEIEMADQVPIATDNDVIEVHAASATPGAASMAESGSEEVGQVVRPCGALPVVVQEGVSGVSQDLAATELDVGLPFSVDGVVADNVDDDMDGGTSEQEKTEDKEASMATEVRAVATAAAVPDAAADAMEAVAGQLAPISAQVSYVGVEDNALSLSEGLATAGDDVSDVQPEVEPVTPEDTREPERPVSGSDGLVEEDDAAVPAADTDGESGAVEAMPVTTESASVEVDHTAVELVSDETARSGVDMATPAFADMTGSAKGARRVEPVATQVSSLVVDEVPEVEAAASIMEDLSINATMDWPIQQLVGSANGDDEVVGALPGIDLEQPVLVTEASVEGDVVVAAAVEKKDDEVDDELNLAGAALLGRVPELRQMFTQKATRAGEETADGEVAGILEEEDALQSKEPTVVHETVFSSEYQPAAPAAVEDTPVTAMPLSLVEGPREDEQAGGLEVKKSAPGAGDEVVTGAVLDTADPSAVADQLPEMPTADMPPIATLDGVIEVDAANATPGATSVAEVRAEDGVQVAGPSTAVPVAVLDGAPEVSRDLAATGLDGALPASVDVVVADFIDGSADGERTGQIDKDDEEVKTAGARPVSTVPDTVFVATEAVGDQLAATDAPVFGEGGEDSTLPLSVGSTTLVYGESCSASAAEQMTGVEPVQAVGAPAVTVELGAGVETSATLDDVQAEVEPVTVEEETQPEQPNSVSEPLVEVEGEVALAKVTDGESGADEPMLVSPESADVAEQTVDGGLVSHDAVLAEIGTERLTGADTVGSSEGAGSLEPDATQLSSAVVDELPKDDTASVTLGTASVAEARSEDWVQVVEPSVTTPVTAPEVSKELEATGSAGELPPSVDAAASDAVDGAVDGETAQQVNRDDEMITAGGGPAAAMVVTAISDKVEAATDQLAPTGGPASAGGVEDSTSPLPVGYATLVHGMSYSASVADPVSGSEPVEAVGAAAGVEQAAGDELSVTLDDVRVQVDPVKPEEEIQLSELPVSASEVLVDEEYAAAGVESSAGEATLVSTEWASAEAKQTLGELVCDDTASAQAFSSIPEDGDTAGPSESAPALESAETRPPTLVVNELAEVEPTTAILDDLEAKADTAESPIEQLLSDAASNALMDAAPGAEPEHPVQVAEALAEGGVVGAAEVVNAVDVVPKSAESAGAEVEEPESVVANELGSGDTAPAEAGTADPAVNGDEDGSLASAEIVELGEAQPTAGDALSSAAPEAEHEQPLPKTEAVVEVGVVVSPAAPGADEAAFAGGMALAPTESVGVEAEKAEIATEVELASVTGAPAMLDAEAPASAPEDSRAPSTGGLVSQNNTVEVEDAAPKGDGQSLVEKQRNNAFGFLPKLLGWAKKEKPHSRVARVESATQAAEPLMSTAAGGSEGKEAAAQGGKSASDEQTPNSTNDGAMVAEPLEEMVVPVLASGGVVPDETEKRLSHEAGDREQGGTLASMATAPLAAGVGLKAPTSTTKKNHDGGFSLPKLFGWVKQVEAATPQGIDRIPSMEMENPRVDDEFSIAAAMMSAEGFSDPIVTDSTEIEADEHAQDDDGDAELATTRNPIFDEDGRSAATSSKAPVLSPDTITDVYNLTVQVGAEHAFPVVALDVPVAEVSPLAHHFSAFDEKEGSPAKAGASSLPVADEPASRMDEKDTTERLSVLSPVEAVDEAIRSEETFKASASGHVALDKDATVADLPSSGHTEGSASAGVDVCGITETGIADTTAAFGAVDLSALMAKETAGTAAPNVGPPAPTAKFRGPRRSLSPGWKGYANTDASSASPEVAGAASAVDQAGVALQMLPGSAESRAGAADPYASSADTPAVIVGSPNKKDCVIS